MANGQFRTSNYSGANNAEGIGTSMRGYNTYTLVPLSLGIIGSAVCDRLGTEEEPVYMDLSLISETDKDRA